MTALDTKALLETLSRAIILLGAVGAIVLVVEEPMTGGSWAMPLSRPALSSFGSRPQAVAPVPASIAIAKEGGHG